MPKADPRYVCPRCGGKLKFSHEDDVGQKWFRCEKCGEYTSSPIWKKQLPEINLDEINGLKGLTIDEERLFLAVKRKGKLWKFRLVDVFGGWNPVTAWTSLLDPEDLRSSRRAKTIRDELKREYGDCSPLESIIGIVQDNAEKLQNEKEPEREVEETSAKIKQQAQELLEDPKLLYKISKDMEKWIVGEQQSRLLQFVLCVSCMSKRDYAFQIVSGESAGGKSWKTEHVLNYLPKEYYRKVGRLSKTSLEYLKDQNFDLLWIQEQRGGKQASDSIRLSSIEDGGTKIWVTERNPDSGRFETHEYRVPGRSIITTTVNTNIDPQDLTRSWLFGVDETSTQTENIVNYQTEEAANPLEFKNALGLADPDLRPVVHEALRQLEWDYVVVVPFVENLKKFVNTQVLRTRRDFKKLIRLIRVVTLIHQKQRPSFTIKDKKFLVSLPQDAYISLTLAWEIFQRTAMGLDQREQKVIDVLKDVECLTRRQVAQKCRKSMTWAENMLKSLVDKGYVDEDVTSKAYHYSLRLQSEKKDFNHTLSDTDTLEALEMENKVESFVSQPCVTVTPVRVFNKREYVNPITGIIHKSPTTLTLTHEPSEQETGSSSKKKPADVSVSDGDTLERPKSEKTLKAKIETKAHSGILLEEFSDDKVAVIRVLDPPAQSKCARCHQRKTLPKQAEYADGTSWAPICEDCTEALNEKLRERAPGKLASGNMLHALRNKFPEKFVDVEFSNFIVKQGWTQTEAESFLKTLEKDGAIFKITEGWRWA